MKLVQDAIRFDYTSRYLSDRIIDAALAPTWEDRCPVAKWIHLSLRKHGIKDARQQLRAKLIMQEIQPGWDEWHYILVVDGKAIERTRASRTVLHMGNVSPLLAESRPTSVPFDSLLRGL